MDKERLNRWAHKLELEGFTCDFQPAPPLAMIAHRSRWEWAKFGNSEVFFMFGEPNRTGIREFSAHCFQLALQLKKCPRPCGSMESVTCFPVAVLSGVPTQDQDDLRKQAAPKHMAAFEFPVLVDGDKLVMFEGTPAWGGLYYEGFRKQARAILE